MLKEFTSPYAPDEAYKTIVKQANYGDFEVSSRTKNEQVVLKGKRSYDTTVLVVLIVIGLILIGIGLIIAAIYYWTRPYQKMIIDIEPTENGSLISIITDGKIKEVTIYEIQELLKSEDI